MVKKLLLPLLLLMLLLPASALADIQVIDNANIIDGEYESRITDMINQIEEEYQVDIVVLTTRDTRTAYDQYNDAEVNSIARNYADDYFDNNGYGFGENRDGMLYLIDMNNRVSWISSSGAMIEYITDDREEEIFNAASWYMSDGNYGMAVLRAMEQTERFMDDGIINGTVIYDEATGRILKIVKYNPLTFFEILIAIAASAGVALIIIFSVRGSYSMKGGSYSYNAAANTECALVRNDELYLRQNVMRRARVTVSSGGPGGRSGSGGSRSSGVHRSSSGRSHGGGGRRF